MSRLPLNASPAEMPALFYELRQRSIPLVSVPGAVPADGTVVGVYVAKCDFRLQAITMSRVTEGTQDATAVDILINGESVLNEDSALSIGFAADGLQHVTRPPSGGEGYTVADGLLVTAGSVITCEVLDNEDGDAAGLFVWLEARV